MTWTEYYEFEEEINNHFFKDSPYKISGGFNGVEIYDEDTESSAYLPAHHKEYHYLTIGQIYAMVELHKKYQTVEGF